ncbi:MAG: alpha/beta hydrolase [Chloroflexaceae bacterium]|nr:alpha/beta hydrolase [Chloroflexaceae bacterium]NJL33936.1 alpha/beta hydrolase [Chloroflexaceae bacterium]NJO06838.1 alpha/beta hydrolase [Chloroflexaceae bacterium]
MLSYRIEGQGTPLLLIHGWGVTFDIWRNLAPLLKPHFRLIMVEMLGVGKSPPAPSDKPYYVACANALAETLQHIGIEKVSVLAYSTGTRVAETFLQLYPSLIERAALLCPIYPRGWQAFGIRMVEYFDQRSPRWGNWMLMGWRLNAMVRVLGFNGQRSPYLQDWVREISAQPVDILKTCIRDIPRYDRTLAAIPLDKTLFIWGKHDLVTQRPRRPLPNDRFMRARHDAPLFSAHDVANEVIPFFKGETTLPLSYGQDVQWNVQPRRRWRTLPRLRRINSEQRTPRLPLKRSNRITRW